MYSFAPVPYYVFDLCPQMKFREETLHYFEGTFHVESRGRLAAVDLKKSSAHFDSASFGESGAQLKIETEIRLRYDLRRRGWRRTLRGSAFRRTDGRTDADV